MLQDQAGAMVLGGITAIGRHVSIEPELWTKCKPSLCGWREKNPRRRATDLPARSSSIVPPLELLEPIGEGNNTESSRLTLAWERNMATNERSKTT